MLPALALLACRLDPAVRPDAAPLPPTRWEQAVDWEAAGEEVARITQAYLRVDTTNPPGNESAGAALLAGLLSADGVPWSMHEFAPGRGNLVARLEGDGSGGGPICLLSHIDVATAEADLWPPGRGPLSGALVDGEIWGRGALDMKGMGAISLLSMLLLKRAEVPLRRDVILLAVADEEVSNQGVQHLVEHHWGEVACEVVINEGGIGVRDVLFEGQAVFPISVGEKGALWAELIARGEPGHGSVPRPGEAPGRLIEAVEALAARPVEPAWHPAMLELLANVGAHRGGAAGFVLQRPALVRGLLRGQLMDNPITRAAITDTVHVTGFRGALEPNVVPSECRANLDCRLQPGVAPEEMLARLEAITADIEGVDYEARFAFAGNVSPWDDPVYEALARHVAAGRADLAVGPAISVGFTDSLYLRPLGVKAYGFVPFIVTEEEAATMHGNGERVSVENLAAGTRVLYRALVEIAGPGAPGTPTSTP